MSKTSSEFGNIIRDFLDKHSFTLRDAAFKSGVSATYWKDLADGRVPSLDIINKISIAFEDLDCDELRLAAGYTPASIEMDAVKAVSIALRSNKQIPQEGVNQILDFVREIEERYDKN